MEEWFACVYADGLCSDSQKVISDSVSFIRMLFRITSSNTNFGYFFFLFFSFFPDVYIDKVSFEMSPIFFSCLVVFYLFVV